MTERLRLEPIGPGDAEILFQLHADADVAHWYGGPWTIEQADRFARAAAAKWSSEDVFKWCAFERASGRFVGRGGLSRLPIADPVTPAIDELVGPEWRPHRLEVGWALHSHAQGHGFATEIGRAALEHARGELDAERVIAFTEVHNVRSRAVMERIGMRPVGTVTGSGLVEGRDGVHDDAPFVVYVTSD